MSTMFNIKNRSAGVAGYTIPEIGVRRSFAPGEVKQISAEELEKLTYQPGGMNLLTNFLQIMDEVAIKQVGFRPEPEYFMSEADVARLITQGSIDEFLDCLDFAPPGVIDLIKTLSVKIPLTDLNKRQALKAKTGFDCDAALKHVLEEKEDEGTSAAAAPAQRRVQKVETGRRAETPKYKVTTPVTPVAAATTEEKVSKIEPVK